MGGSAGESGPRGTVGLSSCFATSVSKVATPSETEDYSLSFKKDFPNLAAAIAAAHEVAEVGLAGRAAAEAEEAELATRAPVADAHADWSLTAKSIDDEGAAELATAGSPSSPLTASPSLGSELKRPKVCPSSIGQYLGYTSGNKIEVSPEILQRSSLPQQLYLLASATAILTCARDVPFSFCRTYFRH